MAHDANHPNCGSDPPGMALSRPNAQEYRCAVRKMAPFFAPRWVVVAIDRGVRACGAMPLIHPIRMGGASRSKGFRRGSSWWAPESRLGGLKLLEVSFGL